MPNKRIAAAVIATGISVAAGLCGSPASAATPTAVYITAGTAPYGTTVSVTLSSGPVAFKDLSTSLGGSCASSQLTGATVKAGAGQGANGTPAGTGIVQVPGTSSSATFSQNCKVSIGTAMFPFLLTGSSSSGFPWKLRADSTSTPPGSSAPVSGQTTTGTLYNISLYANTLSCSFYLTGYIYNITVTNGSSLSTLALPVVPSSASSNLVVSAFTLKNGASSCLGGAVMSNGEKFSLSTTYSVSPVTSAYGPVWFNAT